MLKTHYFSGNHLGLWHYIYHVHHYSFLPRRFWKPVTLFEFLPSLLQSLVFIAHWSIYSHDIIINLKEISITISSPWNAKAQAIWPPPFFFSNTLQSFLSIYIYTKCIATALGNAAGYPGVFWGNPHPYPWKPTPLFRGAGFPGVSHGFSKTPGIPKPVRLWEHSNVVLIL